MATLATVPALAALLVGCLPDGVAPTTPAVPGTLAPGEYLPGLPATVAEPPDDPAAVLVLVPGGGWRSANPEGFVALGASLTRAGYAAVTVTYGTDADGAHHPVPADQIACAVAFAAQAVPDVPVVLVGHSAGGQLAALVGLRPHRPGPSPVDCPYPPSAARAVVGLAGPYDVTGNGLAERLFGVPESTDPELWADGNPMTWVEQRPHVPFLLVHGDADAEVPQSFTDEFADALADAGHEVEVEVLPDATHVGVIRDDEVLDTLVGWLEDADL